MGLMERENRQWDVHHCARCGQDHERLTYTRFIRPVEDTDGTVWDWWATCPTTGDPILARQIDVEDLS